MEHLNNSIEYIIKNALSQQKSLTESELNTMLNAKDFQTGLKAFFDVKGIKFHDLYEAWKRSGDMSILGEPAIRRLIIKEYLHLPEKEKSSLKGSALVAYLIQVIQSKYLTMETV